MSATEGAGRFAVAPREEQIVSPRKHGSEIYSGIHVVLEMVVTKKLENRAGTLKPVRLDTVNCPMNARPQIRVQKAPRQQSRGGNIDRRKRAQGEPPHGQQDVSGARQH